MDVVSSMLINCKSLQHERLSHHDVGRTTMELKAGLDIVGQRSFSGSPGKDRFERNKHDLMIEFMSYLMHLGA